MLNYIRFSTRKGENKTLIEIRTAKDCRLDAVIESVSYPFFECAYSLTAEHGEEWLLRIADLHMENWKEVYMPSDAIPDEDDENWEVAYCEQGEKEKKSVQEKMRMIDSKLTLPLILMLFSLVLVTVAPAMMQM